MQKIHSDGKGYRLRYVSERDAYQFHVGGGPAFEGSLRDIWQKMHFDYEFANSEIRMALSLMEENKHTVANFGIFGGFLFTSEK